MITQDAHAPTHTTEFVYLRTPAAPREETDAAATVRLPARITTNPPPQAPPQLRALVQIWVEALDGRRPVESLRRGPFTAEVIDHLRSRVSEWHMRGTVAASILKSVHLQPCEVGKVRFTATIEAGERVRAISGSLQKLRVRPTRALHELHIGKPAKREYRWRVDSMLLI